MIELARACQLEMGWMVALLALCPIRLKNFVALEIGHSFVQIQGTWWIVLSAEETKENRPDKRPVHQLLTPFIDGYIGRHRPVKAGSSHGRSALWLSSADGTPTKYAQVRRVIKMTTFCERRHRHESASIPSTSAASTAAANGGDNPYLRALTLHHTHPNVTNDHYNRATSLTAAESFRQIVRQYEKND